MPSVTNSLHEKLPSSNKKQSTSSETSSTARNNTFKSVATLTETTTSHSLQQVPSTTAIELKLDAVRITLKQLIQNEKEQISQLTSHFSRL